MTQNKASFMEYTRCINTLLLCIFSTTIFRRLLFFIYKCDAAGTQEIPNLSRKGFTINSKESNRAVILASEWPVFVISSVSFLAWKYTEFQGRYVKVHYNNK